MLRDTCDQILWLHKGEMMALGDPVEVVEEYMAHAASQSGCRVDTSDDARNPDWVTRVDVSAEAGRRAGVAEASAAPHDRPQPARADRRGWRSGPVRPAERRVARPRHRGAGDLGRNVRVASSPPVSCRNCRCSTPAIAWSSRCSTATRRRGAAVPARGVLLALDGPRRHGRGRLGMGDRLTCDRRSAGQAADSVSLEATRPVGDPTRSIPAPDPSAPQLRRGNPASAWTPSRANSSSFAWVGDSMPSAMMSSPGERARSTIADTTAVARSLVESVATNDRSILRPSIGNDVARPATSNRPRNRRSGRWAPAARASAAVRSPAPDRHGGLLGDLDRDRVERSSGSV